MDYGILNVRTDVNACDCTQACTDKRERVCTESWLWEKKIPCLTGKSNLRRRRAGPMLYQLSYITHPRHGQCMKCVSAESFTRSCRPLLSGVGPMCPSPVLSPGKVCRSPFVSYWPVSLVQLCSCRVVCQSHWVPVPLCPSPAVSQSHCVPVLLCPSPFVSQSCCVPVPLCIIPVLFPWSLDTMEL